MEHTDLRGARFLNLRASDVAWDPVRLDGARFTECVFARSTVRDPDSTPRPAGSPDS